MRGDSVEEVRSRGIEEPRRIHSLSPSLRFSVSPVLPCFVSGSLSRLRCLRYLVATTLTVLIATGCGADADPVDVPAHPSVTLSFEPRIYAVQRAEAPLAIDGRLDEEAWQQAAWTGEFVDIQGPSQPAPRFRTRAKMLWDDDSFYVAAHLEEPDVWATLTERDTVIFYDNDFEVFIDPDSDTHNYYELEVNAFGTLWDLMLLKPYRDGGPAIDAWDVRGVEVGVDVQGTLNDPSDMDDGWTVEIAMPWSILEEAAPEGRPPQPGDRWRVNFSRVQWRTVVENGRYRKEVDPETGDPLAEDNWVWSPQGAINMHMPERWGVVQFAGVPVGKPGASVRRDPNQALRWALRRLYYRQNRFFEQHGRYADRLSLLRAGDITVDGIDFAPRLETTTSQYEITAPGWDSTRLHIRQDGRIWTTPMGSDSL